MDLGSTNGTFLNGERLEPERYYELLEKVRPHGCAQILTAADMQARGGRGQPDWSQTSDVRPSI